jgi:enoyl-CoA hydratase/carnithine racemase
MAQSFVSVERRPDDVALLRLDRPKANALSLAVLEQIEAVARSLTRQPPGAVVVWGGPGIFAAGADVSEFGGPREAREISRQFRTAFDTLASIPRAIVAAVCGYALGGGCELALACDLRVVSEDVRFGQPEILLGIIPGAGGTQRLTRLIGPARAKDMILTGRQVGAEEALRIGLADRVVPAGQVLDAALQLAASLATGAVVAHGLAKQAVDGGLGGELEDGLDLEAQFFARSFETEDARIGVRSFLDHGPGKARFVGR